MNELVGVMLMTDMYGERNTVDKTICRKIAKKKIYIKELIDETGGRDFYSIHTQHATHSLNAEYSLKHRYKCVPFLTHKFSAWNTESSLLNDTPYSWKRVVYSLRHFQWMLQVCGYWMFISHFSNNMPSQQLLCVVVDLHAQQ